VRRGECVRPAFSKRLAARADSKPDGDTGGGDEDGVRRIPLLHAIIAVPCQTDRRHPGPYAPSVTEAPWRAPEAALPALHVLAPTADCQPKLPPFETHQHVPKLDPR
jgi:hypothetical protein